jgi:hypothetical protein
VSIAPCKTLQLSATFTYNKPGVSIGNDGSVTCWIAVVAQSHDFLSICHHYKPLRAAG